MRLSDLRVCIVAGTLGQGGAERQIYFIVRELRRAGAAVRVLALTRGEFWQRPLEDLDVEVVWVGEGGRPRRMARIAAEARRMQSHVVQSQHFFTNIYAALAARATGVPSIGALRSNVVHELTSNGAVLGRLCLRMPEFLAANSEAARRTACSVGASAHRVFYLPNAVERAGMIPTRDPSGFCRLLAIGRFVREKRYDVLLDALAMLNHRWAATLAGDGPLRSDMEQRAPLGVTFAGLVPDPAPLYGRANVFILSSDHEGTPNVVLEAMSHGLPVVATRVGGVPALVEHGETGLLVEPGNSRALAEALDRLCGDADLRQRLGKAGQTKVQREHSCEALRDHLERLYHAVLTD